MFYLLDRNCVREWIGKKRPDADLDNQILSDGFVRMAAVRQIGSNDRSEPIFRHSNSNQPSGIRDFWAYGGDKVIFGKALDAPPTEPELEGPVGRSE